MSTTLCREKRIVALEMLIVDLSGLIEDIIGKGDKRDPIGRSGYDGLTISLVSCRSL